MNLKTQRHAVGFSDLRSEGSDGWRVGEREEIGVEGSIDFYQSHRRRVNGKSATDDNGLDRTDFGQNSAELANGAFGGRGHAFGGDRLRGSSAKSNARCAEAPSPSFISSRGRTYAQFGERVHACTHPHTVRERPDENDCNIEVAVSHSSDPSAKFLTYQNTPRFARLRKVSSIGLLLALVSSIENRCAVAKKGGACIARGLDFLTRGTRWLRQK